MNTYDFFISYHQRDQNLASDLSNLLIANGYTVFTASVSSSSTSKEISDQQVAEYIKLSNYFIPLVTDSYKSCEYANYARSIATSREKMVIPIMFTTYSSKEPLYYYINKYPHKRVDADASGLQEAFEFIKKVVVQYEKNRLLYEKLSEHYKAGNENRTAAILCELIYDVHDQFAHAFHITRVTELYKDLYKLFTKLSKHVGNYDEASVTTARKIICALDVVAQFLESEFPKRNLLAVSLIIRLLYLDWLIRANCNDTINNGSYLAVYTTPKYIEKQSSYVEAYHSLCKKQPTEHRYPFTDEELHFIEESQNYILTDSSQTPSIPFKNKDSALKELPKDDEILHAVANFMQEGNKLFDLLQKDGVAGDFLKCLLTSYERLKNYCEIVGASNVASECIDRIAEIRYELATRYDDTIKNQKAESGIKSLLGLTTPGSGNYDVFISFKNADSDIAGNIYSFFKENLLEAFWSKVSLPELSKSDYEEAIMQALDKSKHFIVVISNLDYLEADWIKREMKIFNAEINEGRKKDANFIIIATDDVYNEIIQSNKTLLPIQYRWCQILKLSEYKGTILNYIKAN